MADDEALFTLSRNQMFWEAASENITFRVIEGWDNNIKRGYKSNRIEFTVFPDAEFRG